jgi:hypothetical protein
MFSEWKSLLMELSAAWGMARKPIVPAVYAQAVFFNLGYTCITMMPAQIRGQLFRFSLAKVHLCQL